MNLILLIFPRKYFVIINYIPSSNLIATNYFYIYAFVCKNHPHIHIYIQIYISVCVNPTEWKIWKNTWLVFISNKVFMRKSILFEKSSIIMIRMKHGLYRLNVLIFLIGMFVQYIVEKGALFTFYLVKFC